MNRRLLMAAHALMCAELATTWSERDMWRRLAVGLAVVSSSAVVTGTMSDPQHVHGRGRP